MNIRRRIEVLEQQLGDDIITMVMPGPAGGVRTIRARRLPAMLGEALRGQMADDTRALIESVSDDCRSAGYGYFSDLIRVFDQAFKSAADDGSLATQ